METLEPRTWWYKVYIETCMFVLENLQNISYEMIDNPGTDSRDSFVTGPPQFTLVVNGKLKHYNLERADVDEHYDELEEAIWAIKQQLS